MASFYSRVVNSVRESWDNFTLGSDRAKVAAIDRAVAYIKSDGKTSLGSSKIEQITKFLLSRRREEAAKKLVQAYYNVPLAFATSQYKIEVFLEKLCTVVAPEVYKIPVPEKGVDADELYKDLNIVGQAAIMREFKNLLNQAVIEMTDGEKRLTSTQLDLSQGAHLNIESAEFYELLKTKAREAQAGDHRFFSLYSSRVDSSAHKENIKQNATVRNVKNALFYTLMVICTLIGIGEGSAPASFFLTKMGLMGLTGPLAFAIAAVVFVAAASVNTLLFHGDSYSTFKDLFIKNRFLKGADGKRLPWYLILRNCAAFVLAAFSGLTIAGLSYYFSLFPAVALFISAMTLIGYTGVLTYGVMQVLDVSSIRKFGNYLHGLLVKPIQALKSQTRSGPKEGRGWRIAKTVALVTLNALAVTAMFALSATVVTATFLMFKGALLGIPFFAANFGTAGVIAIVATAEVALGTFFSRNVFRCLEAIRGTIANMLGLTTQATTSAQAATILKAQNEAAKHDHPVRKGLVLTSKILLGVFVGFALINASGFALGYLALGMTAGAALFPQRFADMVNRALVFINTSFASAVGYLFGTAYVAASTGGNVGAAAKAVAAPEALLIYPEQETVTKSSGYAVKADTKKAVPVTQLYTTRTNGVQVFTLPKGEKCFISKLPPQDDEEFDLFADEKQVASPSPGM